MKKILILVLLWIVLFGGEDGLIPAPKPKVNVGDFISDFEAMGYAGLFHMMPIAGADEIVPTPKPDNNVVKECRCVKTNGKVSFDGGTSWTDCPCKIGQCDCGCANSKVKAEQVKEVPEKSARNYSDLYYVLKFTGSWCAPCRAWNTRELQNFKNAKIAVVEVDVDKNPELVQKTKTSEVPNFVIASKLDRLFHFDEDGNLVGYYKGADFDLDKAYELMGELDKHLHPNIDKGLFYDRQQTAETKLNNKLWATKQEYLNHLTEHNNHKIDVSGWPLVELSSYELKAVHDDDHANKLGVLNGL